MLGVSSLKSGRIAPDGEASALEALAPEWRWSEIKSPDRTPMQHFIWTEACFATMYRKMPPVILITEGGLAAFIRRGPVQTLHLAGAQELAEPAEPLYRDAAAAECLVHSLLDLERPVRLGQPPADTAFMASFLAEARTRGHVITAATEGAPYIALDQSWIEPSTRFNARRRSDFRRMRRRAEEAGEIRFEFHSPGPGDVLQLLNRAVEVETRNWKGRQGTSLASNRVQREFFRQYGQLAAARGILRTAFMKIGKTDVATQLAVECEGSLWLLKIGYDESYSRCSPGQLLMLESIGQSAAKGLRRYEMLGKAAAWTRFWTENERPRMKLLYYPRNLFGVTAFVRDAAIMAGTKARSVAK